MNRWQENVRKHVVPCPHCKKEVLDHMTECPFCRGELKPRYYTASRDPTQAKNLKRTMNVIGFAIAAVLIVWLLVQKLR